MPDGMVEAHLHGVRNALAAGWSVLERGGAALDAVEEAVVIMEDDETFDAGRGSFLNRDGKWMRSSWMGRRCGPGVSGAWSGCAIQCGRRERF
jgi:isoaspartyl peptidase/L-asparaginase-like protein (Ntn-hydrolase superfamily)